MKSLSPTLARVIEGHRLTRVEMAEAVTTMMEGLAPPIQAGALLAVLRARGETVEELVGAVQAVRSQAQRIEVRRPLFVDTCGTGGDGAGTFNISTAAALVTAACGVPVAKHGNRSVSSKCGSADVLGALGATLELDKATLEACLDSVGLTFLFAPAHHPAFRHLATVRRELGVRTLFNLVGPLANPAGARRQVVGVFDPQWVPVVAEALSELGAEHALVVHGSGLDELTVCGESLAVEVRGSARRTFTLTPESVGLRRARLEDLRGGDAEANASIIRQVLAGELGPRRDVVLLNAAAALLVAGRVDTLEAGIARAAQAVDCGEAERLLARFVRFTRGEFSTLDRILSVHNDEVAPPSASDVPRPRSLAAALSPRGGPLRVIAEVKRASPSLGLIAPIADPVALARAYAEAGAAGISVLTETAHFGGSLADLRQVSAAVATPTLRKDFVVNFAQLANARAAGASAVLLIVAVLGARLAEFLRHARALGLEALVEVHDDLELDVALAAGAQIVGINHRDLRTFAIDLTLSERLLPRIPASVHVVCESGVRSVDDAKRLRDVGASNLLIGEALVRSEHPGELIRKLGALP
jgi:anthranilate phosphoribosyltransferase